MKVFHRLVTVSALTTLAILPLAAHASDEQRIESLERQLTNMQRMMYGQTAYGVNEPGGAEDTVSVGGGAARSLLQMNQLEDQIRQQNGKIEQLEFANKRLTEQLEKFMTDVEFRFNAVNTTPQVAAAPTSINVTLPTEKTTTLVPLNPDGTVSTTAKVGSVAGTPAGKATAALPYGTDRKLSKQEKYDFAFGLLNQSRFDEAEISLKKFVEEYPDDALSSNAYYWLGETYYVRKNYGDAASTFMKGFQKFPKGNKAADSVLKLGMSLGNADKKKEACATFAKLKKDYPNADAAVKQRTDAEEKKLKCS